jgi:hypothetical protein
MSMRQPNNAASGEAAVASEGILSLRLKIPRPLKTMRRRVSANALRLNFLVIHPFFV